MMVLPPLGRIAMKDKTLKMLLGIIAINLTIQTANDTGFFTATYAQSIQKVAICDPIFDSTCARVSSGELAVE